MIDRDKAAAEMTDRDTAVATTTDRDTIVAASSDSRGSSSIRKMKGDASADWMKKTGEEMMELDRGEVVMLLIKSNKGEEMEVMKLMVRREEMIL